MQVSKVLYFSDEEIFDVIFESAVSDVKKINREDFKEGYTYTKKIKGLNNKEFKVRVKVLGLQRPSFYHVSFETQDTINHLQYRLEKLDTNETRVSIMEDYESSNLFNNLNYKVLTFILSFRYKKKLKFQLDQLEQVLENKKENV